MQFQIKLVQVHLYTHVLKKLTNQPFQLPYDRSVFKSLNTGWFFFLYFFLLQLLLLNCYCMIFCWCKKDLTFSIKQFHHYLKKSPSCWFFFDFHAKIYKRRYPLHASTDDEYRYEYTTSYKKRVINYNDSLFNIFV